MRAGTRRHRLEVARGGHRRSQLAALRPKLFDLAFKLRVSGRERAASTAQRCQRLDETVAGVSARVAGPPPTRATPLTRLKDCCGMCIQGNFVRLSAESPDDLAFGQPSLSG